MKYSVNQHPIEMLLSWIKAGEIAIPEIQRPFVWKASQVRDLMDSLYKGYPVGYIITWRNQDVRLKDGTLSSGKRILIDGQQRITALTAAVVGKKVLNNDYKSTRIKIAYNPLAEEDQLLFEVSNNAIERNPRWITDISPILNGDITSREIRCSYMNKNPNANEDLIEERIEELKNIKNRQVGIIELNPDLDIDTVTEIFIRINQKGVVLSNADFVMSKIASDSQYGGNKLRKMIDYFCHLLQDGKFLSIIENNDLTFTETNNYSMIKWIANRPDYLYNPKYIDVLRVAYTYGFQLGKFSTLVALLSGRDFENRRNLESIAEDSYRKLQKGLEAFFNQTYYERFLQLVRSAGFVNKRMINSKNSLNMAYAIYLHLANKKTSEHQIQTWVKKWLVMSVLTSRYSGSTETIIERDIKQINDKGISACLEQIELTILNDGFWTQTLVSQLDSSNKVNSAYLCYLAAQCKNKDNAFLSDSVQVASLLEGGVGNEHHIFPKAYLKRNNQSDCNQVANYTFIEQQANIRLGDKAPNIYLDLVKKDVENGKKEYTSLRSLEELEQNMIDNCIPNIWQSFDSSSYDKFLFERRKLMAEKIKEFYFSL